MANSKKLKTCDPMSICSVMTRDVVTFSQDASILDIAKTMKKKRISCVVITDKRKRPVGMITERDLLSKVLVNIRSVDSLKAKQIMGKPVMTTSQDTSHVMAGEMMRENNIRRFPVVKKDKLVGIVTESDIIRGMIKTIKKLNFELVSKAITIEKYLGNFKKK